MRFAIFAAVCLSLVVFATANDLHEGGRQDGDVLVQSRRLLRPAIPGKQMVAKTGFHARGEITAVNAVNAPGSNAKVMVISGGPGLKHVVVTAVGEPGSAVDVKVDIYATLPGGNEDTEPESA